MSRKLLKVLYLGRELDKYDALIKVAPSLLFLRGPYFLTDIIAELECRYVNVNFSEIDSSQYFF